MTHTTRMFGCLLLAALLFGMVAWIAPQQVGIVIYKLALVLLAGYAGYWLDAWAFPYAHPSGYLARPWRENKGFRPDTSDFPIAVSQVWPFLVACLRRAGIIIGAMLAVGLGL